MKICSLNVVLLILTLFITKLKPFKCSFFGDSFTNNRILRSLLNPFTSTNCNIPTTCYGSPSASYYRPGEIMYPSSSSPTSSYSSAHYHHPMSYYPASGTSSSLSYSHSYPVGYSTYTPARYMSPLASESTGYYPYPIASSYYGYSMYGPSSGGYSWPSSSLISRLRLRDSTPKYMGRGVVNTVNGGITDLTCNFADPSHKIVSNAAWVKVLGPYNYHEPIPPFECTHPDCSLIYINGSNNLRYRVLTNGPVSTLRIYETAPLDRGIYRCTVTGLTPDGNTNTLYQVIEFVH